MTDARAVATQTATDWALMYPIPAWSLAEGAGAEKLAGNWARVVVGMIFEAFNATGIRLTDQTEPNPEGARPPPAPARTGQGHRTDFDSPATKE